MDTKIYEYLIAVEEYKNITKAAEHCFISQPALTQHIKKLEAQFQFSMFQKAGKSLIPTPEGKIFLTTAKRMIQIEKEILLRINKLKSKEPKTYRVYVETALRETMIQNICPELQKSVEQLELSLLSGDGHHIWDYLDAKVVDIAIFPFYGKCPNNIEYIPVEKSEYLLLVPPGHTANSFFSTQRVDFQLLQNETFILHEPFSFFNEMEQKILENLHIVPKQIVYTTDLQSVPQMVYDGQGIAFFPAYLMPYIHPLCPSFSLTPPCWFQYIVAYPKKHSLTACDTLLADLLIKYFDQPHRV